MAAMPLTNKPAGPLRPGEATTYVELAMEFAQKWRGDRQAQLEAEVRADLARQAARKKVARGKIRRQAQVARRQRAKEEDAEQRRFRMPKRATLRGLGGRPKESLREKPRQPRFRWDSAYAPAWVDPKAGPPPTAYKEFKASYERAVNHEAELAKAGKPVVARLLPKIPAAPPAFEGAMGLDWHAGVEAATVDVRRRERKLEYDMKKGAMTPDERIVAQRLQFLNPVPELRPATRRYADADRERRAKAAAARAVEQQQMQDLLLRGGGRPAGGLAGADWAAGVSRPGSAARPASVAALSASASSSRPASSPRPGTAASHRSSVGCDDDDPDVARAEGKLAARASKFFTDRLDALEQAAAPRVARAMLEQFTEVEEEAGFGKYLVHRELLLNGVARQWSDAFISRLLHRPTIYDKHMLELSLDGFDDVGRLDAQLPPFESRGMHDRYARLRRMGADILNTPRSDDEADNGDESDSADEETTTFTGDMQTLDDDDATEATEK